MPLHEAQRRRLGDDIGWLRETPTLVVAADVDLRRRTLTSVSTTLSWWPIPFVSFVFFVANSLRCLRGLANVRGRSNDVPIRLDRDLPVAIGSQHRGP
jgi:hypothetical protein